MWMSVTPSLPHRGRQHEESNPLTPFFFLFVIPSFVTIASGDATAAGVSGMPPRAF
jgi:hypothetical protein